MIYFVNPPRHPNIGDIAIFYASSLLFNKHELKYEIMNIENYKKFTIKPEDKIVILGGGWVGIYDCSLTDFYYDIINKYEKTNKIIMMPNSFAPIKKSFNKIVNAKITIFARDPISYDNYKKYFKNATVKLCPDIVYSLPRIDYAHETTNCTGVYARKDVETVKGIEKIKGEYVSRFLQKSINYDKNLDALFNVVYKQIFTMTKYDVIVTDTLHMSIFAYLLKKPCIIFDNNYGKVNNTWKQYKHACVCPYDNNLGQDINKYNFNYEDIDFNFDELVAELKK